MINKKKRVFYSGDLLEKKAVSKEVKEQIRKSKIKYRNKIESQYCSGDLRAAWRGIKSMASINQSSCETRQPIRVNSEDDNDGKLFQFVFLSV